MSRRHSKKYEDCIHEDTYYTEDDFEYGDMSFSDARTEAWLRGKDITGDKWWINSEKIIRQTPVGLLGFKNTEDEE